MWTFIDLDTWPQDDRRRRKYLPIGFRLGPIYTERQRQRCDDAGDISLIEKNVVLQNGLQPNSQATPFCSIRTASPVSLRR